jgi:PAS domain S-box-containing protein
LTIPATKGDAMTIDNRHASGETALRIIEALPNILIAVDRQTHIQYINRAPAGVALDSALGRSVTDYVAEVDREAVCAVIQGVFATGRPDTYEMAIHGQSGEVTSYATRLTPIWREGVVEQVLLLNEDIAQQKQTAKSLQESERQARILFMTSMDAIMLATPTGRVLAANPAGCAIFGRDEAEMQQLDRTALVDVTDPRLAPALAERARTGHFRGELTFIRKDGSKFPGEVTSARFEDEVGNCRTSLFIHDVTERKRAEEQRTYLATVLANVPDAIISLDGQSRIRSWNAHAEKMYGWTADEVMGRAIDEVCQSRYIGTTFDEVQAEFVANGTWGGEVKQKRKDGQTIFVQVNSAAIRDATGALAGAVTINSDVTERRQSEQTLAKTEALYRQAISATKSIPYQLDYGNERYTFGGPDIERLTGYAPFEMTPTLFNSLIVTAIPRGVLAGVPLLDAIDRTRLGETDGSWQCDYCIRTHSGEERWLFDASIQVQDEQGQITGAIGILQDITERKQAEAVLHASEERYRQLARELEHRVQERTVELQTQRDFARQVMDALGQGLLVIDAQHRLEYINPFIARELGMLPSALIGRLVDELIVADDLPIVHSMPHRFKPEEEYQYELRMKTASGQAIPTLVSSSPRWHNGKVTGRIAVITDLTQVKMIESELRQSRDELSVTNLALERALRMKDEFLASMSHELRTPLTGILGLSEALQMQSIGPLNERQLRGIESIWDSGQHLLELINDILDLSKLESTQFELEIAECDVDEICSASLALVKGMAQQKRQQIDFTKPPGVMRLYADPRRLKQMLVNLLSNAVKFTPVHGAVGLRVQGDAARQVVEFVVWDKGIGIAPESLPRLFQPFTQLDSNLSREFPGTGLGLALVQRMAELHKGTIHASSTPGIGSTFTLTLPWPQPKADDAVTNEAITNASVQLPAAPAPDRTSHNVTILLAEDSPVTAEAVTDLLSYEGFTVVVAANGLEAVQKAGELLPALILMDIQMPLMDGFQAIARIRADSRRAVAQVPIIALTAQAMHGDAQRCLAAGANDYVSKPFRLAQILESIHRQLPDGGQTL